MRPRLPGLLRDMASHTRVRALTHVAPSGAATRMCGFSGKGTGRGVELSGMAGTRARCMGSVVPGSSLCGQAGGGGGNLAARCQDTDGAGCLERIDPGGQMSGCRRGTEHLQCGFIHEGLRDVQLQVKPFPQGVGPFSDYIKGIDAVDGDMPLCNHLRTCVVEINTDNNVELRVQDVKPSPALAATLQLFAWPFSSASYRVGVECDARNTLTNLLPAASMLIL